MVSEEDGVCAAKPLDRAFYRRAAVEVAPDLLGTYLVHCRAEKRQVVRIVETEAYVGAHDLACHASRGRTRRTAVMFGPPGYAYVYLIYGMYYMLNVVTSAVDDPQAVLIRAAEPVFGVEESTGGPGRLTRALGIDLRHNGIDLCGPDLFLARGSKPARVAVSQRVGVDYAGPWAEEPLRFYDPDSPFVSR